MAEFWQSDSWVDNHYRDRYEAANGWDPLDPEYDDEWDDLDEIYEDDELPEDGEIELPEVEE